MNEIRPLRDQIRSLGHEPELSHVSIRQVSGSDVVCAELGLEARQKVWRADRLFAVQGLPAVLLCDYLPVEINGRPFDPTPLEDVDVDEIDQLGRQVGSTVLRMEGQLQAEPAPKAVAQLMQVRTGAPLVRMVQRTYDTASQLVIYSDIYYRTDVATLSVVRTRRGAVAATTAGTSITPREENRR
jgi:DNA-binding GntR family transcriptional regulator